MTIKVKIDLSNLNRKISHAKLVEARKFVANDAQQSMERYVPKLHGYLRDYSMINDNGSIIYTQPYAKAQFYGVINGSPVKNYTTPGTSSRWDLRLKGNVSDMRKLCNTFINAVGLNV